MDDQKATEHSLESATSSNVVDLLGFKKKKEEIMHQLKKSLDLVEEKVRQLRSITRGHR